MTALRLLLVGGGGHCVSCLDVIRATGHYEIVGILDRDRARGEQVAGVPVVGDDDDMDRWVKQTDQVLITLGMTDRGAIRETLYQKLHALGAEFARVISPRAYVSQGARLGVGCIVMHDALVNHGADIGNNCIINTKALVEHGTSVGHHCHISTRATLNGDVRVGNRVLIGSHAVVFPGCQIGDDVVVGGGQVIRGDLEPGDHPNRERKW